MTLKVVIFTLLTLKLITADLDSDVKLMKCLVCEATINELNEIIDNIDPDLKVEVGNYKLDAKGDMKQRSVPISQSETHLSEVLDGICDKMDDYVRARRKSDGQLTVMKIIIDGVMNPESSNVDFVQDDDLNKSLKYYCEGLLEEHEENIIKHYIRNSSDIDIRVCSLEARYCSKTLPDPNEDYLHEEL